MFSIRFERPLRVSISIRNKLYVIHRGWHWYNKWYFHRFVLVRESTNGYVYRSMTNKYAFYFVDTEGKTFDINKRTAEAIRLKKGG